jgi:hypothetical protein
MEKPAKYLCTIKLIDESIHPGHGKKSEPEFLSVTVFAKTAAGLPQVAKVGSILRIHRGQVKKFKDQFQLNCDVNIKGSWVLFDPIDGMTAIGKNSSRYTFVEEDKKIIGNLRKFIKTFFAKNELEGITFKEAEKKKPKDFDVVCYVLDVKQKGKVEHAKVCDATGAFKLELSENRKGIIAAQEVIRIRSAEIAQGKLKLSEYSSILRIPKEFQSAKEMLKGMKEGKLPKDVKEGMDIYAPSTESLTKLVKAPKGKEAAHLKALFGKEQLKEGEKFKVHVSVVDVGPKNPHDWICVYDKKSKKQMKLDEVFGKKAKGKLPEGMAFYYKLQLFVKDKSVKSDGNLYTLFLCTVEGKGKEFINVDLGKEQPGEEELKKLKKVYKMLTKPSQEIELCVEAVEVAGKQPVFFIVDTELLI